MVQNDIFMGPENVVGGREGANYPQAVILSLEAMSYNLENSLETVGFFCIVVRS